MARHGLQHLLLDAGQIERGARCVFAAHVGQLAQHRNHHVGIGGGSVCPCDPVGDVGRRWAAAAASCPVMCIEESTDISRVGAGPATYVICAPGSLLLKPRQNRDGMALAGRRRRGLPRSSRLRCLAWNRPAVQSPLSSSAIWTAEGCGYRSSAAPWNARRACAPGPSPSGRFSTGSTFDSSTYGWSNSPSSYLTFENGQNCFVDLGLGHLAVGHQPGQVVGVGLAGHVHVEAGVDGLVRSVGGIARRSHGSQGCCTAKASETTNPLNPHSLRRMSVSSQRLPLAGTSFRSM